jgi:hypothetical protein
MLWRCYNFLSKMSWSASLLRKAALGDPRCKDSAKAVLEGWIDDWTNSMDPIDLENKTPLDITEMLDINLDRGVTGLWGTRT